MIRWRRDDEGPMVAAFDALACLLLIFVILTLTEQPKASTPRIETLGLYAVVVTWNDGSNDDVDTYLQNPQGQIVYWQSTQVGLMHLEQDDLGTDISGTTTLANGKTVTQPRNQERVLVTGIEPGEYIVNVHMYTKADPGPVKVKVELWRLRGVDEVVVSKTVILARQGQVITPFRFTLNAAGDVTGTSTLPKDIVDVNPYAQTGAGR